MIFDAGGCLRFVERRGHGVRSSWICRSGAFARLSRILAGACIALATIQATAASGQSYSYHSQFGSSGTGEGQFGQPAGIAIDPASGNILVSDGYLPRVQIFSSAGRYLTQFGRTGSLASGDDRLQGPGDIAIDPVTRDIFVADENRVKIFTANGNYLGQIFGKAIAIDQTSRNRIVCRADGGSGEIVDIRTPPR